MNNSIFNVKNIFFVVGILMVMTLTFISMRTPFIYQNRPYLCFIIGYFLLAIWLFCNMICKTKPSKNSLKNKPKPIMFMSVFLIPLGIGFFIASCLPAIFFLCPSSFTVHEYKVKDVRLFTKKLVSSLGEVYVTDRDNLSGSFYLKKNKLKKLDIKRGDMLVLSGRSNVFGFLITQINAVKAQ